MAFFLFLLVNATLFIRPAEIVPGLLGWRIYEALILSCLVAALPDIFNYFAGRALSTQPMAAKPEQQDPRKAHAAWVEEPVWDSESGQDVIVRRLRGTGIFQDPNDLCLALCLAMPICLYWFTDRRLGMARVLWLAPLGL